VVNKVYNHGFKNTKVNSTVSRRGNTYNNIKKRRDMLVSSKRNSPLYAKYVNRSYRKGPEIKTLDNNFTAGYNVGTYSPDQSQASTYYNLPINNNGNTVQCLNLCQQGAGISQRIGHKISLKSLRIRLSLVPTGKTTTVQEHMRILIVYDRQPIGSYTNVTTLLGSVNGNNVISTGILTDSLNPSYYDRFVVLSDDFRSLPVLNTTSNVSSTTFGPTEDCSFLYDKFIKLNDLDTTYNGSGQPMAISNVATGALLIYVYSDAGGNSTDPWMLNGSIRLRYVDN